MPSWRNSGIGNVDGTSPVTASVSGTTLTLTSKQAGVHTNYLFSTSDAYNTQYFSTPSFTLSPSAGSLQNGANSTVTTVYDAGTVSVTVGSMTKTASFGDSSNSTTEAVATAMAGAFNGDGTSPVTATVAGGVLNLQAKAAGTGSGLALSASATYDTADFPQSSFTATPSAGTLAGGSGTVASPATLYTMNVAQYAPDGNILQLSDSVNGNWAYTYDDFNRLASSNKSGQQAFTYGYDRFGNRWSQAATIGSGPQPSFSFSGNNNRMDGYAYDAAGNLLNDGTANYVYDDENRIVQIVGGASYVYDADGQRVRKTTSSGTFDYLYDLSGHAITEVMSTGMWTRGEIYAGGRHLGTYANGTTYFSHEDHLGTERVRSNVDGTWYESCANLPFGDGQSCTGGGDDSPLHFTGKQRDTLGGETGLDYFGARYYTNTTGRFMQPDGPSDQDPDDPQSWNLYTYTLNNPLRYTDPDGEAHTDANGFWVGDKDGECGTQNGKTMCWNAQKQEWRPRPMDGVSAGFLGPVDVFFIRVPDLGIASKLLGAFGRTVEKAAAATAEKAADSTAEAALRQEVQDLVSKAASTVGNQGVQASSREAAEQAAKEWVGSGAEPITDRTTGVQVGWKSADGMRVARFTRACFINRF